MPNLLYFDCQFGICGDMTIGALLDLGADWTEFQRQIGLLGLPGYKLRRSAQRVNGIGVTDFDVLCSEEQQHRNIAVIEEIILNSDLDDKVKQLSTRIFRCIAAAEAAVHRVAIEEVHFHEVGAVDSIIDIVGAAVCLHRLGNPDVYASPLHLGTGFIRCAHGTIPIPAPATVKILEDVPAYSTGIRGDLVTPTGAAIIKTLARDYIPLPPIKIKKTGNGKGKKDYGIPNILRLFWGQYVR